MYYEKQRKLYAASGCQLSDVEQELLNLMARDETTEELSVIMSRSPRTIESIRTRIKDKLDVKTLPGLMAKAIQLNLVDLPA